jgi:hypothetical protein
MPASRFGATGVTGPPVWLTRSWWLILPSFAVLTLRFVYDRACGDPRQLVPELTSHPVFAWPLAVVYVSAHLWMLAAYVMTVRETGSLLPGLGRVRAVWDRDLWKIAWLALVMLIEQVPIAFWRVVGASVCGHSHGGL